MNNTPTPVTDQIADFIRRYIFLPEPSLYRLHALWIIGTYFYEEFDYYPYLMFWSADKGSGKTRVLEVSSHLVRNSSGIMVTPTQAVLARTAKGHTQLLDEIDSWGGQDFCRSILNAGYQRGGTFTRMEQASEGGEYVERQFDVYAPRMLAGIGSRLLAHTTQDRCLSVRMVRRTRGEQGERFRLRNVEKEIQALRDAITAFVADRREIIRDFYDAGFAYLKQFSERTEDIAEPLAAILEVDYCESLQLEEMIEEFCEAIGITRGESDTDARNRTILAVLVRLSEKLGDPLIGSASELADLCTESGEPVHPQEITVLLKQHGFPQCSYRRGSHPLSDNQPRRRYRLSRESMIDVQTRYYGLDHASDYGKIAENEAA